MLIGLAAKNAAGVEYRKQQEFRVQQEAQTRTWQDVLRLANERYEGGVTSFLEVLDTERELFSAELTLAQAQLAERLAGVRLYRALGGSWQLEPIPAHAPQSPSQREFSMYVRTQPGL